MNTRHRFGPFMIVACLGLSAPAAPAAPGDAGPSPESPEKLSTASQPDTQSDKQTGSQSGSTPDPLPSLDELLGLDNTGSNGADSLSEDQAPPPDQQQIDLERKLTAQDAAEALSQALTLMDDTAARLSRPGGTGLETQRLQEDILRKLDTVIEAAQQNQGQGSGSSAGAQSRQSTQNSDPGKQQSGGAQSSSSRGQGNTESMPAQGGAAELGPQQLLDASAWGALPDRLRDSVRQGLSDKFSAAYRSLTEAYYRRLAEEAEGER